MKKFLAVLILLLAASMSGFAADERIPGQKPLIVITGSFQFEPGSWARYTILDKITNESYKLSFAVLGRKKIDGKNYSSLEIAIRMNGRPNVVTRVLAEETRKGPGALQSAIVQVTGRRPFTVPKALLKPEAVEARVAPMCPAVLTRIGDECAVCSRGRIIQAWRVEARSAEGKFIKAVVSEQLPPLGISELDSSDIHMSAEDWGRGAGSEIRGTPIPLWLWLADEVTAGVKNGWKRP